MPHKGAYTQHHNQQVLAKPHHQPSNRDQQAREKLKQKAKIKSQAYIQLGEEALQTVHQTFQPNTPVILHLPALVDGTIDSSSNSLAQIHTPSSTSKQANSTTSSNSGSNFTTNPPLTAR